MFVSMNFSIDIIRGKTNKLHVSPKLKQFALETECPAVLWCFLLSVIPWPPWLSQSGFNTGIWIYLSGFTVNLFIA